MLLACGERVAGGGPSGTEAGNAITARIIDQTGAPVVRALARLRPQGFRASSEVPAQWDTYTDANGNLQISIPSAGDWNLELRHAQGALLLELQLDSGVLHTLGETSLKSYSRIEGQVPLPVLPNQKVYLLGTEHGAYPDSLGHFVLDSLPPSDYVQILESADNQGLGAISSAPVRLESGANSRVGVLQPEESFLVLEDFFDGDTRHRFWSLAGGGWWYLARHPDVIVQGPIAGNRDLPLLPVGPQDAGCLGHVVHYTVQMDSAISNPWVELGVQLGFDYRGYDMRAVDSVRIWARGTGEVVFRFQLTDGVQIFAEALSHFNLSPEWGYHTVRTSELQLRDFSVTPRGELSALLSSVRAISFTFVDDAEFWLDRVELHGASRREIWGR